MVTAFEYRLPCSVFGSILGGILRPQFLAVNLVGRTFMPLRNTLELNGPHVPLIGNLVVQPNARRRGVAKNLMQAAEEEAKSWPDFNMIYCAVKPTNNPAISLYCDKLSYAECQLSPEGDAFLPNGGTIMTHVQEGLVRRNSPRLLLFKRLHP